MTLSLLNGISYGLLLFMLSAGLTLIFSMMGVLNFAHAAFYMLGAYLAYTVAGHANYWVALVAVPIVVGLGGALFEATCLRRVHPHGQVAELLVTFGLGLVLVQAVQLVWGRVAVPYGLPPVLQGPLFQVQGLDFPKSRAFIVLVAVAMLGAMALVLRATRLGLIIQAALTHPDMTEALGHNVPRVFMIVFGAGAALAGLAGVVAGNTFTTEPSMADAVGVIIFVVVIVGGMGSLTGAFIASLLIGLVQTFGVAVNASLADVLGAIGLHAPAGSALAQTLHLTVAEVAPVLPYLLMVLLLVFRPRGLLGKRES